MWHLPTTVAGVRAGPDTPSSPGSRRLREADSDGPSGHPGDPAFDRDFFTGTGGWGTRRVTVRG